MKFNFHWPTNKSIELQNITNLLMFNTIYMRKELVNCKCTFLILELFLNGTDEFDGYWEDHEY